MATPNIGLNTPVIGSNFWGGPTNFNWSELDLMLSGLVGIPGLLIEGDLVVEGSITAGTYLGLDGAAFLTSALFNQPFGIPQLDATAHIPASLLPGGGITVVAFSATPVFNAAAGSSFKITLAADVTSSTFANGLQGSNRVVFRIVQDSTGGHNFAWPANVRNGGAINPGPNSRSVQEFALDTDGSLDACGPIMYS